MKYVVYILRTSGNTLYIGQTNNLSKRLQAHQSKSKKSAKYLRQFASCELVYSEEVDDKSAALKREAQLKKLSKTSKEVIVSSWIRPGT